MPENPYTANPYSPWSVSGLITYDEAQELRNLAPTLCCSNFLIDWRAGSYLRYAAYLWARSRYRGFYDYNCSCMFIYAGSFDLLVTPEYLRNFNGLFILRVRALHMPEAYSPTMSKAIDYEMMHRSLVYSSNNFVILFYIRR